MGLPKPKKCVACGAEFQPQRIGQKACGYKCANKYASEKNRKKAAREFNRETKRRKVALKTASDWLQDAQSAFNRFIRARDFDKPCITCGEFDAEPIGGCMWDAGHFKSKQSHGHLRFNELACHREHSRCNRYTPKRGAVNRRDDMTHDQAYRVGLVDRIGEELVEFLEGPCDPIQYRIDELKWLKKHYTEKAKEAERHAKENSE